MNAINNKVVFLKTDCLVKWYCLFYLSFTGLCPGVHLRIAIRYCIIVRCRTICYVGLKCFRKVWLNIECNKQLRNIIFYKTRRLLLWGKNKLWNLIKKILLLNRLLKRRRLLTRRFFLFVILFIFIWEPILLVWSHFNLVQLL